MNMKRLFSVLFIIFMGTGLIAADEYVEKLTDSTFDKAVKNKLYFVDFYANWCGPCREFSPNFAVVAEKLEKHNFAKVDIDVSRRLAQKYNIRYIPYIVAIKNGKVLAQYTGNRSIEDFLKWCKKIIDNN